MRALRSGGLLALALFVLAVVAAPALATPGTTASSAQGPYWTPIGNTRDSSFTATSSRLNFSGVSGDGVTTFDLTCMARMEAYVPVTHTRALVTSLLPGPCTSPTFPTADIFWFATADSVTPFALHLTARVAANSWSGTLSIPMGGGMTIWVIDNAMTLCRFSIPAQSLRFVDTDVTTSFVINDSTVVFRNDVMAQDMSCPDPGRTATIGSTFTFRPQTATDNLRSTAASGD
jgi:hypothetical protein